METREEDGRNDVATPEANREADHAVPVCKTTTDLVRTDIGEASMLAAARQLASLGWSVIPASGKRPAGSWKRFQSERADAGQIESWWHTGPEPNIAVVTGKISDIIVLDIDGEAGFASLAERGLELPETVRARTGRGRHYYFKHPGFVVPNSTAGFGGMELPQVDLRGDGGVVIAPPSVHPDGGRYTWEVAPWEREPAEAPDWLFESPDDDPAPANALPDGQGAVAPEPYLAAALAGEVDRVCSAPKGRRNDTLNRAAFSLGQLVSAGLCEDAVVAALTDAAAAAGLEAREISASIRSGLEAGKREPRPGGGFSVLKNPPVASLPPYPVEVLPDTVRDYVTLAARSVDCPPEMVAVHLLTYAGAAIGNTRRLRLKADFEVFPILWTAVVAPPGAAKTPADKRAREPLEALQSAAKRVYDDKLAEYREQLEAYRRQRKGKGEGGKIVFEPDKPQLEHFFTTDATIEAVAVMVSGSAGVVFAPDELVGWVKSYDAYKSSKGGERAQYLSLWSAGTLKVDRKGAEPLLVERPVVCVTGNIQPAVLPELAAEVGRLDGFLERFCFAYCDAPPSGWTDDEVPETLKRELLGRFMALRATGGPGSVVGLSDEARELWVRFFQRNRQITEGSSGLMRGANAKMPVQAAALALILHCLGEPDGSRSALVSEQTLEAALAIVEYHRAHNAYVLDRVSTRGSAGGVDGLTERMLAILDRSGGWVTRTDLDRALHGNVPSADRDAALVALERLGVVERRTTPPGERGGRPAVSWRCRHAA